MTPEELLSQLKDIHLPAEITFWPLAPGWWFVIIITVLTIALSIYAWRKHTRNNAWKKEAKTAINAIKQNADAHSVQASLHAINLLIKQVALYKTNDTAIKSLSGREWSGFLNDFLARTDPPAYFSEQQLSLLAEGQYQPTANTDINELIKSLDQWIKEA